MRREKSLIYRTKRKIFFWIELWAKTKIWMIWMNTQNSEWEERYYEQYPWCELGELVAQSPTWGGGVNTKLLIWKPEKNNIKICNLKTIFPLWNSTLRGTVPTPSLSSTWYKKNESNICPSKYNICIVGPEIKLTEKKPHFVFPITLHLTCF